VGEEIERHQLLERDERPALRDHERRDAELEATRAAGEKAEGDERLGDRAVRLRLRGRDDQVVGHPAGVEAAFLCGKRDPREPLRVERLAVVRQDHAEVQRRRHADTLDPLRDRSPAG
jgi:hypothetical protein